MCLLSMQVRLQAALIYHLTVQAPLTLGERRNACSNTSDHLIVQAPQQWIGLFNIHVRLQYA